MPHNDNRVRLQHMLDAAEEIHRFLAGKTFADLSADRQLQYACLHCLSIIGEAANHLDPTFCESLSDVPWRPIIAMRHRLIHGYFEVELSFVWQTITVNIPQLISQLRTILDLAD